MTKIKYLYHHTNYHSHTWLCRHAEGEPIDYLKEAKRTNLNILGISDHAPFQVLYDRGSTRMTISEYYSKYIPMLNRAKEYANQNNIKLYYGLEIEYLPNYDDYYLELFEDMDYLILGQHYIIDENNKLKSSFGLKTKEQVKIYRDMILEALETNYFSLVCHPELCFYAISNPTDEMYELLRPVIKKCVKLDIPLELNANGIRKVYYRGQDINDYSKYPYPQPKFWQMVKEEGATGIITSDAHQINELNDWAVEKTYEFANNLGIKLITKLQLKPNPHKQKEDEI